MRMLLGLTALLCLAQATDPWSKSELLQPADLASTLKSGKQPAIYSVAFPVLFRNKHLPHAVDVGPGSKPEGIDALKKAVAQQSHDAEIVIYCGCCPMGKCPNIRPAYRALKEMGFTRIKVLEIPENMHADWYSKNYPSEPGSAVK